MLTEEVTKNLKEAGCYCVRCALECGNDEVRNKVLRRKMSKQQILNGVRLLHKYNIKFVLQNMLCLPNTDIKIDLETLALNIACKPTLAWLSIFQPYPGTELGDLFPEISIDNINPSFYEDTPIKVIDKKLRIRLQKLFGVVVKYSMLKYLLPILLRLTLDNLYRKIWLWNNKISDKELYGEII